MMQFYIPEIKDVIEVFDKNDEIIEKEFQKVENKKKPILNE